MGKRYAPSGIANSFQLMSDQVLSQSKLQKLVYLAHGWNLAINNAPLIDGHFEVTDSGPQVTAITHDIRRTGRTVTGMIQEPETLNPYSVDLSSQENDLISHVWEKYGAYTEVELLQIVGARGTPWSNAFFGSECGARITDADDKSYFIRLALEGRSSEDLNTIQKIKEVFPEFGNALDPQNDNESDVGPEIGP